MIAPQILSMDVPISATESGLGSFSFSLVGIVGLLPLIMAGATVWLLLTDPVTVAESVDSGEVTPLVQLAGRLDLRRAGAVAAIPVQVRSPH